MSLRANEAAPLLLWYQELLTGAVLQELRHPARDRVVLSLRIPGETIHLLLVAGGTLSRLHTVARPPTNPKQSLAFQGLLRKELSGRLASLASVQDDRVLRFRFEGANGLVRTLVQEYTGTRGLLALLDSDDRILGTNGPRSRGNRSLRRGELWVPPPPPDFEQRSPDRFAPLLGEERNCAVALWFEEAERKTTERAGQTAVLRHLRSRKKALERRAQRQSEDADRAKEAGRLREEAMLLQASFHQLRRGMDRIEVMDCTHPEMPMRTVELDPRLSPQEQVDGRFRKARRAERAGEMARHRLEETLGTLDEVTAALLQVEQANGAEELEGLLAGLPAELRPPQPRGQQAGAIGRPQTGRRGPQQSRLPYRIYRTAKGQEIWVGRGASDNDDLSFRHAGAKDVWMHVRGRPGAHVVLRKPGASPSPELLLLVGQVALAHSGIAEGAKAEVAWTRVKEVKKPKGFPPGKVLVGREKVLYLKAKRSELDALKRLDE